MTDEELEKLTSNIGKREVKEYYRPKQDIAVWNMAIEAAIKRVKDNVYHEAQDTDWDLGYNHAKKMSLECLEWLKK